MRKNRDRNIQLVTGPFGSPASRLRGAIRSRQFSRPLRVNVDHKRYFFEKFGITERLLERCLGEALSAGGDYADLYFESVAATSIGVDESIVKSASQGVSAGCGVRVVSGERTGYAYTDDLSP